ncbi:MAG: N-acetyltransferase family protein [Micavibrio sp.]
MQTHLATLSDIDDLALIHVEGWRASYAGLVDPAFLANLDVAEYAKNWRNWLESEEASALIARDDAGNPAGFISFGRLRTPIPGTSSIRPLYSAEIYALYILPAYWRAGLGRQLMAEGTAALREKKHKSVCLWVLEGNKRAVAFYKALGGQRCGTKRIEIAGKTLPEIAFGWRDTTILQMTPS